MTTNVFDKEAGVLATDSRWSYSLPGVANIYVDNVEFEKIASDGILAFMFAGDSLKINEWKSWINSPNKVVMNQPKPVEHGFSICMVDVKMQEIVLEKYQEIKRDGARFAGTGAIAANRCWEENRDPKKAVESAIVEDCFSGGEVKYLDLLRGTNNLCKKDEFSSIKSGVQTRGYVMYFQNQNQNHIPVAEAANADERISQTIAKIAKGDVGMTAPSPAAESQWSDQDREDLTNALLKYYPAK